MIKISTVELAAKEVLVEMIKAEQQKYPMSLKVKDIIPLLNCSQTQAYEALNACKIPGAKKIEGLGWRINRDIFFTWLYSNEN